METVLEGWCEWSLGAPNPGEKRHEAHLVFSEDKTDKVVCRLRTIEMISS